MAPPPSRLAIATQVVKRLLREESSYHEELAGQQRRVQKLHDEMQAQDRTDGDPNAAFMLKQEKAAMDETKAVFVPLRLRITSAVHTLEEQMAVAEGDNDGASVRDELNEARAVLEEGRKVVGAEHD